MIRSFIQFPASWNFRWGIEEMTTSGTVSILPVRSTATGVRIMQSKRTCRIVSSGWKSSHSIGTEPHRLFRGFARLPDSVFCHTVDGLDIWGR
jgi:hypothetical protein